MEFIRKILKRLSGPFNLEVRELSKQNLDAITSLSQKLDLAYEKLTANQDKVKGQNEDSIYEIQRQTVNLAKHINQQTDSLRPSFEALLVLNGMLLAQNNQNREINNISDAEFKVFSQFGEDGILQFLINKIEIKNKIFIEFGVGNYEEASSRFLLQSNYWKGLVMDGYESNIEYIKSKDLYWKYDLTAKGAFITKENINGLISDFTKEKEIGVLIIDIDGNDYWIWETIEAVDPTIVVCEYNSTFGFEKKVTIPYQDDFSRTKADVSDLYFGASLAALVDLGKRKGYAFIGCNKAGNDAFFVKKEKLSDLKELTPEEGFSSASFKQSKDINGQLLFLSKEKELEAIKHHDLYDIETDRTAKISEIFSS